MPLQPCLQSNTSTPADACLALRRATSMPGNYVDTSGSSLHWSAAGATWVPTDFRYSHWK